MRLRLAHLVILVPLLLSGSCKKKKKRTGSGDTATVVATPPEVPLQVVSVEPDQVAPNAPFKARVYGSAFQQGARVWVGGQPATSVTYQNDNTLAVSVPPLQPGPHDVRVENPDGQSATLRGGIIARQPRVRVDVDCDHIRVHFDFDSADLTPEAQQELADKLVCFEQGRGAIRVEGNTDERGTTDYNLALGQRRAEAVARWLEAHNVPPSRIRTISYGEERPIDPRHTEEAWAQNRRTDVVVSK